MAPSQNCNLFGGGGGADAGTMQSGPGQGDSGQGDSGQGDSGRGDAGAGVDATVPLDASLQDAFVAVDSPAAAVDASGIDAAAGDDAGPAAGWAAWPMPNSPSSGLPNPQSYDTSVSGTALDKVTGLMWQRDLFVLSTAGYAVGVVAAAAAYCQSLTLAGHQDWRVPSRIELVSVMDFSLDPALNATVFPTPAPTFLLSSSVEPAAPGLEPSVGLGFTGGGNATGGSVSYLSETLEADGGLLLQGPDAVRCVRGSPVAADPHYRIQGGTVYDNATKLTWLQATSSLMLPSAVASYCTGLTASGGGWRAPSVNEVETLWGEYDSGPNLDPVAFAATLQLGGLRISSSTVYVGPAMPGVSTSWLLVVNGITAPQDDVLVVLPVLGGGPAPPASDYWVYAQCVK